MRYQRQKMEVEHVRHAFSVDCKLKQFLIWCSRVRRPDNVGVAGLCADKAIY